MLVFHSVILLFHRYLTFYKHQRATFEEFSEVDVTRISATIKLQWEVLLEEEKQKFKTHVDGHSGDEIGGKDLGPAKKDSLMAAIRFCDFPVPPVPDQSIVETWEDFESEFCPIVDESDFVKAQQWTSVRFNPVCQSLVLAEGATE